MQQYWYINCLLGVLISWRQPAQGMLSWWSIFVLTALLHNSVFFSIPLPRSSQLVQVRLLSFDPKTWWLRERFSDDSQEPLRWEHHCNLQIPRPLDVCSVFYREARKLNLSPQKQHQRGPSYRLDSRFQLTMAPNFTRKRAQSPPHPLLPKENMVNRAPRYQRLDEGICPKIVPHLPTPWTG